MGTRVDQNIQTKNTRVHVLIRTFRLRTHGTRVDQNIQNITRVDQNILRIHGYTC